MTRLLTAAAFAAALALPSAALADDDPSEEEVAKIMEVLTELECEMDEDDIEKEDDGYELDDVFCADGQYDIDLDANFEVTNRKKE